MKIERIIPEIPLTYLLDELLEEETESPTVVNCVNFAVVTP